MKNIVFLILVLFLTGCAVGNKYSYESTRMAMPFDAENNKVFVLLVKDLRPYVLNGKKQANFVGLQRGGFGNPFDVTTSSGKPMTEAMSKAISKGLSNAGYTVIDGQNGNMNQLVNMAIDKGASRIIVLAVHDWKSDLYANITMHVDLRLKVYQANGDLLAETSSQFNRSIGAAKIGEQANSVAVTAEFEAQIRKLFGQAEIKEALNSEVKLSKGS